jgi:hypothetical protein
MLCADRSLVSRVREIRMHGLNGGLDRPDRSAVL